MTDFSFIRGVGVAGMFAAALACNLAGTMRDARADDVASFGVPLSPNAHIYSYFVINGIARGAYLTGKLKQKDMAALIQMDEATRKVVLHSLDSQTIRSDFRADQALAHYLATIPR